MDAAILQFFESIRNPFLTAFFGVFSLFGETLVLGALLVIVFWLAPRRTGEQIVVTVLSSFCLNSYLKFTVARARPYTAGVVSALNPPLSSSLDPYASFPSGHVQTSAGFFGSAASRSKRILPPLLCLLTVILVALSRLYFGVHYPTDVLGGFLFGAFIVLFWALVFRVAYSARLFILLGTAVLALVPLFLSPSHEYLESAGLYVGAAIALSAGHFLLGDSLPRFSVRLRRLPVGLALALATFSLTLLFPAQDAATFLKWMLLSLVGFLIAPAVFERLEI